MAVPPLLTLAPEIIHAIAEQLDGVDIKTLRLTCQHLAQALAIQVWRVLDISMNRVTIDKTMPKLRALATSQQCAAAQGTRELRIGSLCPFYDAFVEVFGGPSVITESVAIQAEKDLKLYLFQALTSLKAVQSVIWCPVPHDETWVLNMVMEIIKSLPNLRALSIDISFLEHPPKLEDIARLRSITLFESGPSPQCAKEIFYSLAKLTARSPQLISIDIAEAQFSGISAIETLEHLFEYYPTDAPPLNLRRLCIYFCGVDLDHIIHLRSLTCLKMKYYLDGLSGDIWQTLLDADIRLEEIEYGHIGLSLLNYLDSYSGIRCLYLLGNFKTEAPSKEIAARLFDSTLHNHIETLEELHVAPCYDDAWSFEPHRLAISRYTRLKSLSMHINILETPNCLGADSNGGLLELPDTHILKIFIETAILYMPRLEALGVGPINQFRFDPSNYCPWHGYSPQLSHLVANISRYRAPPSCPLPSTLRVTGMDGVNIKFKAVKDDSDGGRWKYI